METRFHFGNADHPLPEQSLWEKRARWKQVHGTRIVEIASAHQEVGEADGFVTDQPNLPLSIATADCVPILLSKGGQKIGALHAGWRGTFDGIVTSFFEKTRDNPSEWRAWIGPSAGPCCYEVSPELASQFEKKFSLIKVTQGRYLDLKQANAFLLREAGVREIDIIEDCTICSSHPRYFSFRRDKDSLRQYSTIWLGA